MKNPLVIANWKMKLSKDETLANAKKIVKSASKFDSAEVVLCPDFTEISEVSRIVNNTHIQVGAQDCSWEEKASLTGEVSPTILRDYGVKHIIIGHSERRQELGETDEMIHKKIRMLLSLGITPILCIGETFEERQEGKKEVKLINQVHKALDGIWFTKAHNLVVAYEPIWVIGSGQAVDPFEVEHTNQVIRQTLYDLFAEKAVDEQVKIIYGGSVDPENVGGFIKQPSISGVLVGTASLDATEFSALISASIKR